MGYDRFTLLPVFSILVIREADLLSLAQQIELPETSMSIAVVTKIGLKDKLEVNFSFESSIVQNKNFVQGSDEYKDKYGNLKDLVDRYTPDTEKENEKDESGEVDRPFWYTKIFEVINLLQTLMGSENVRI